jgi:predicted RecB family nuclease
VQLIDGRPVYSATDLVGFLACSHRLALERAALAGLVRKPMREDPQIDLIAKRGLAHERRYRDELIESGRSVVEIQPDGSIADRGEELRAAAAATIDALRSGVDVVYQATFFDGRWVGFADFLLRVERPSALGSWSYEVADTKLARHVKGGAVLQICSYVDGLRAIQGLEPECLHVVLGGSAHATESLRVADYMAYYRRVKREFEAAVAAGAPVYPVTATYPDPVEHCDVCRWVVDCKAQRRSDDDLSLVAGITARQRRELKARNVRRRSELALLDVPMRPRLDGVTQASLLRIRDQARLQVESDPPHPISWTLLDPERDSNGLLVPDRGLLVLPEPDEHDLFFDIEGDPFALEDGVEYLFGVLEPARADPERADQPYFHAIWSREGDGSVTRSAEKAAFEDLVDLLIDRLDAHPGMHVYHYAAYERTALGRLAQRHATRELEVDRLLRGGVLIDLFRVVRQGLQAGLESYSIKRLEPLYGLVREVELRSAGSSIVAFETWLEGGTDENGAVGEAILATIAGYNRDDVLSNWRLRDWLEARRPQLEAKIGEPVPRPGANPDAERREMPEREVRAERLGIALTAGLPEDPKLWSEADRARWLLAQLLGWHRREDKAFWWRYFYLCRLTDEDLIDEREPIGAIRLVEDLGPSGRGGRRQAFEFPPQDHRLGVGDRVDDPRSADQTGTVVELDDVARRIVLHRTKSQVDRGLPTSLVPQEHFRVDVLEDSIARTAEWAVANGIDAPGELRAVRDLLLRSGPRLAHPDELRHATESGLAAARRLALELDRGTLAIQGPPGSGKTYTGARMIVDLVRAGKRVGVTANSHKVIGKLLDEVAIAARDPASPGRAVRIGQVPARESKPTCATAMPLANDGILVPLEIGAVDVVGGTAWVWSRPELAAAFDVVFIDEAGQLSLATAVAIAQAAKSLVLLGDPQQLDQPLQGTHPPGAERSALAHLLDGKATMPAHLGLFLDRTWRLHPDICTFTSEVFYSGRLEPQAGMERQALLGSPALGATGIRWAAVKHAGNSTDSEEEAEHIAHLVGDLLGGGSRWRGRAGVERPISLADILIVAPYNAHVDRIAETLAAAGYPGANVGTVDKFQGQEAPISIYAMASSTPEDAPRGMEFLYSLNRLNVATSRARCVAVVVASPALVRVACQTPRQMQLANALCRFVEIADMQAAPTDVQAAPPDMQLSWLDSGS